MLFGCYIIFRQPNIVYAQQFKSGLSIHQLGIHLSDFCMVQVVAMRYKLATNLGRSMPAGLPSTWLTSVALFELLDLVRHCFVEVIRCYAILNDSALFFCLSAIARRSL